MRRLLLAVLTVALTSLAAPALAAPPPPGGTALIPQPQSQSVYDVPSNPQEEHQVEAADGVKIFVETYLPEQREGGPAVPAEVPIVLISTPYDTLYQGLGYYAILDHLVKRGYGVAINHVRGTGNSGGCLEQTATAQIDDTARVIHFLGTEAEYSTGSVGMYGVSYDAETQVSVAGLGDPELIAPLKAIVPLASVGGQYEYSNYDGVPFEDQALFSNATYFPISAAPGLGNVVHQFPHEKLNCQPEIFEASLDRSGDMTPFWMEREYRPGAPNVRAATLYVHGLRDFNVLDQTIRGWFDRIPASTPRKGMFGVWEHAEPDGGNVEEDWQRRDWLASATAWYDRYLKGLSTGVEQWPDVQVQDSTGRWRAEGEFPLNGGPIGQLALAGGGGLGTTASPSGSTTFNEEDDPVEFTTAPVAAPLSVTGQPVLDLWLTSSEDDAHIAGELEVLGPDGEPDEHSDGTPVATYGLRSLRHLDPIVDGWFRQEEGRPAPAGTPIRVPIRFLPTDLVVPAGGSLRLRLTGLGDEPRTALASGAASDLTILHDCAHASTLRFLEATPGAPQLDVREVDETNPLGDEPRATPVQDGGGLAARPVCGRAALAPDAVLADPSIAAPPAEGGSQDQPSGGTATGTTGTGASTTGAGASTTTRQSCAAPTSRFTGRRSLRVTRTGIRLRGRANGRGCAIKRVRVSIARKVGSQCRFLRADGTFSRRRSCKRTSYLTARGTTRWSFERRLRLPKGKYLMWSRVETTSAVERKERRRNMARGRR